MMKQPIMRIQIAVLFVLGFGVGTISYAQGYGSPLTMQGLNHSVNHSAASRSMGGLIISRSDNAALMFLNPSVLQRLSGVQFSIGDMQRSVTEEQTQQWNPLRYIPTFSLLMEGLTDSLRNPDLSVAPDGGFGPEDSVARPYDSIKPNWSRTTTKNLPVQVFAAAPFEAGGMKFVAGIGAVQYANMDYYFQNNNVLSPSIGSQRPYSVPLPAIGKEVPVQWSQYSQSREGSMYGYGAALSAEVAEDLSIGISGLVLSGSTDDVEKSVSRGTLRFGNNDGAYYLSLDSVYARQTVSGTSDFSGIELTVSSLYHGKYLSLSLSVKPPTVITRKFALVVASDSSSGMTMASRNGQDEMTLPLRGSAAISLAVRNNVTVGFQYELQPYSNADYKNSSGTLSHPWLSSTVIRFGAEFRPMDWLALRAGYSEQGEVFQEAGNPLVNDPVNYSVYSGGAGFSFESLSVNVAYEYSQLKYQDLWQTNVNLNNAKRSTIVADVVYHLPW